MERHLIEVDAAIALVLFAFLLDLQSFIGGLRYWKKGSGRKPMSILPFLLYVAAAFASHSSAIIQSCLITAGLAIHLTATIGIRWAGRRWAKAHMGPTRTPGDS